MIGSEGERVWGGKGGGWFCRKGLVGLDSSEEGMVGNSREFDLCCGGFDIL